MTYVLRTHPSHTENTVPRTNNTYHNQPKRTKQTNLHSVVNFG